jgi:hypothetical protein
LKLGGLSVLKLVVFVLIVGEELGWRGYALPRLLAERSVLAASLILGRAMGCMTPADVLAVGVQPDQDPDGEVFEL